MEEKSPVKKKLEDEDDQSNTKLKDYEGTDREEPKKKMYQPKEVPKRSSCVKKNGTKIRSTKPSSKRIPMDVLLHNDRVLSTLEEGHMVEIPGLFYSHWVVYIGDGVVVHLTGADASTSNVSTDFCVKEDNYWDVVGTSRVKKNNSKDETLIYKASNGSAIKKRALSKLGPSSYNVVLYNCEHFASWCRYGIAVSDQADAAKIIVITGCGVVAVANIVQTDRAHRSIHSKKNAPQNMCGSVECHCSMSNGTSCIDAVVCHGSMSNETSRTDASVCALSSHGSMSNETSRTDASVCALSSHGSMGNGTPCIDASVCHGSMGNGTPCIDAVVCHGSMGNGTPCIDAVVWHGSMGNGTPCIDAVACHGSMGNGTPCIDAVACNDMMRTMALFIRDAVGWFPVPEIMKQALPKIGVLSIWTGFSDWDGNITNFADQALPWVMALGVCVVAGKLAYRELVERIRSHRSSENCSKLKHD